MATKKKPYEYNFKAKMALAVIASKKTIVELSAEHKVPQMTLIDWRDKLEKEAKDIFLPESEKNKKLKVLEQEVSNLHKIIGEITVENNFFKKKFKQ
jgi:transposase-like protein